MSKSLWNGIVKPFIKTLQRNYLHRHKSFLLLEMWRPESLPSSSRPGL